MTVRFRFHFDVAVPNGMGSVLVTGRAGLAKAGLSSRVESDHFLLFSPLHVLRIQRQGW
jgi:hypothetical protein